jgi:hypothetical protein
MAKNPYPSNPYAGAFNTPLIGGTINNLGQTGAILATPCSIKPQIWVQAAFAAAPIIAYTFIKPFMLAWQFHARAGRSHRGKKGILKFIGEFEPEIAPEIGTLQWVAFSVADAILKLQWYLFVADRTASFLVNWTSLAYEYSGCTTPDNPWAFGIKTDGNLIGNGQDGLVGPLQFADWQGNSYEAGTVQIPAGFTGVAMYTASVAPLDIPIFGPSRTMSFTLRDFTAGTSSAPINASVQSNGDLGASDLGMLSNSDHQGHSFGIIFNAPTGAFKITEMTLQMYCHPTGTKGLEFDP